ncbi:MAG: alpha-1,2-fucosyltransferase [Nanoarchaeota archaeon]
MKSTVSFSQLGKMGRLGNAMWQVSALISYCNKHKKVPVIPNWEYLKYFKNLPASTENIVVDKIYNEPHFHYSEIPYFEGNVDLRGYMQSPKYHEGINVQELFELKDEYKKQVDDLYAKINPKGLTAISCHVRRGDYLNESQLAYHGVLPYSYYEDAMRRLCGNVAWDNLLFVVCSDDIKWCKENFPVRYRNYYFSEGEKDIVDLFLMAKCNDNILANSSFSYWAALLNKNPDKKVIAPAKWFNNTPHCDTKDLYLPEMIVI